MRSLLIMLAITAAACGKDTAGGGPDKALPDQFKPKPAVVDTAKLKAPALFANIPADTPYVVANFEPLPLELFAKIKAGYGPLITKAIAKKRIEKGEADEDDKVFDAIMDELGGTVDAAKLESLGLSAQPHFALYGIGLAPLVIRIEIKDEKTLLATVERIAKKAEKELPPTETKDGKTFWRKVKEKPDGKKTTSIIGVFDGQLVIAGGPSEDVDAKLDQILGTQKPAQSMADGKLLIDVMQKHGLGPHLLGYIDTRRIAAQAAAKAKDPLPQTCTAEIDRIAAKVPRMVVGYTEVSSKQVAGGFILELEPGLLAELNAMKTEVPGLGAAMSDNPMMAFGGGFDIQKGIELVQKTAGAFSKVGDLCNEETMSEKARDMVEKLGKPLPAIVKKITGAVIAVHDFEMDGRMPKSVDALAMVTSPSAKALYDTLKELAPPVEMLGPKADGKLHEIEEPGAKLPFKTYGGVSEKVIVVGAGSKGKGLAEKALYGTANGKSPFLVATFDYSRMLPMMKNFQKFDRDRDPDDDAATQAVFKSLGRAVITVDSNDKGLVFWGSIELK